MWVVDSHFVELSFAKDSLPLLLKIKKVMAEQIDICDKMKSLSGNLIGLSSSGFVPSIHSFHLERV